MSLLHRCRALQAFSLSSSLLIASLTASCVWIPEQDYKARIDAFEQGETGEPDSDADTDSDSDADGDSDSDTDTDTDADADSDADSDLDDDGYLSPEDCDDNDPEINPAQEELCNDGIDNNCDDILGPCGLEASVDLSEAEVRLEGEENGDMAGFAVASGDVTGDGYDDLFAGAPWYDLDHEDSGRIYAFWGPVSGHDSLGSALVSPVGDEGGSLSGYALHVADLIDDERQELLVGAPLADGVGSDTDRGRVYLFYAEDEEIESTSFFGANAYDQAGSAIASARLGLGPGLSALIGAPGVNQGASDVGAVYAISSPLGIYDLSHVELVIYGTVAASAVGASIAAGDLNGDDFDEIAIGSHQGRTSVYILEDPGSGVHTVTEAATVLEEADEGYLGWSLHARDLTDDGYDDLAVGAPGVAGSLSATSVLCFLGGSPGPLLGAAAVFEGELDGDLAGQSISSGDINRDGVPDLVVGAPGAGSKTEPETGVVYVVYGPLEEGGWSLSGADVRIVGETVGDQAGASLATGDLDADDADDIIIGVVGYGVTSAETGAVYVVYGEGL